MPNIPIEKHQEDIQRFTLVQGLYKNYADILKEILEKAVSVYAPLGVVQARAKSIGSFSEKVIRKDKYKDPLRDITDLCGARTIVHFESQVEAICHFIRENFEIDEINSVDVKTRLKVSEFGYRSVHYIVAPNRPEILGIAIPKEIRDLKAEIQVRTFNEHVWADILHDRIYKTKINVPSRWQRESARLAAMLEEIDNAFYTISGTLDQFSVNYRPTPARDKLNNEISVLKTLISINPEYNEKTIGNYLKLVVLYNMLGQWSEIIDLLTPVIENSGMISEVRWKGRINYELGYAFCMQYRNNTKKGRFKQGIKLVEAALQLFQDTPVFNLDIAKASSYLAKLYDLAGRKLEYCIALASKARRSSPENPYYLLNAIVENFGAKDSIQQSDIDQVVPQLHQIITTCCEHIEMGIESPDACIAISLCSYLLGDETASIENLILLLHMAIRKEVPVSPEIIYDGLRLFSKVTGHKKSIVQTGILHIIGFKALNLKESKTWLKSLKTNLSGFADEVMIIAGKSSRYNREEIKKYSPYVEKALGSYTGTVISGGTDSGLPGLVGTISGKLKKNSNKHYTLIGYLPEKISGGIRKGKAYDTLRTSTGAGFSFNEVLLYWSDILLNELPTEKILLLGVNGGPISELEYTFALSMGARVVLIQDTGGAVDAVVFHKRWSIQPNLILLPADPDTLWALVCMNRKSRLDKEKVEDLARIVHETYRRQRLESFKPETSQVDDLKVVMPWEHLDPKLKISNIRQVEFFEHLLKRADLGIRVSKKPVLYAIHRNKQRFEQMARLEHSRWNAERLLAGWRYGPVKNIDKKINPCITGWDELNEGTKKYDYEPIKNIPVLLAKAGYEVYKF
jgi:ppGpp synthetase/RelA/SpoT-type nucleotidyltranferase